MGIWQNFKYSIMNLLGIQPKIEKVVLDNLRRKEEETLRKGYVPEQTPNPIKCSYKPCKKRLRGLTYNCHYCGGRFCEEHRLPEDHDCEEPDLPISMRSGYGTKSSSAIRESQASKERN
jgi:predicted nucleic acid binding AN1-type Zn finger protein